MPREVQCPKWKGEPFRYAHAKRDGIWLELIKDSQGVVSCWTRQPRDITQKLLWHPAVRRFTSAAPPGTVLYCELWVAGAGRDAVKGAMRDRDPMLRIECFAVEKYSGSDLSPSLQLRGDDDVACYAAYGVEDWAHACGLDFTPFVTVDWFQVMEGLTLDETHLLACGMPDTEGWVLKDGNLLNWRKLKAVETYDLRVVDFTPGKKKYEGQIGAIVLESSNGRRVKCSGMTDYQRLSMTERRENWIGVIVEVACQGRGSAGGLAHPRFVRVREDKTEADALE